MCLHMEWIPRREIKVVFAQVLGESELCLGTMEMVRPVASAFSTEPSMNLAENKLARDGITVWSSGYEHMKEVAAFSFSVISVNIS